MKKLITGLMFVFMFVLAACGNEGSNDGAQTVGIAMPPLSLERWERDGNNLRTELEALGYNTDLQFAEDVQQQVSQIENMITRGVDALIIAAIDGEALTEVLNLAAAQDVVIIAYDRLIRGSEHVSYYITFDNFLVGETMGNFIIDQLGVANGDGPFNIELFAGSPDDNNAIIVNDGAMSVLQPYIDSGDLIVRSGQTSFNQIATQGWLASNAQIRMDNLLSAHYTTEEIHAVLVPADAVALGIISSLESLGFGTTRPMPIVTGQDADLSNVLAILDGRQSMTVFKDINILASSAATMVDVVLNGNSPTVNDTTTYDNGVQIVPAYLVGIDTVIAENVKEVLVESGFYSAEELGL
ncbi:MAG: substrate-binding domain-containing protein [Turicibacter sp.]|nr:substrate-binding domain-containing protein [Turicibacter sp.]